MTSMPSLQEHQLSEHRVSEHALDGASCAVPVARHGFAIAHATEPSKTPTCRLTIFYLRRCGDALSPIRLLVSGARGIWFDLSLVSLGDGQTVLRVGFNSRRPTFFIAVPAVHDELRRSRRAWLADPSRVGWWLPPLRRCLCLRESRDSLLRAENGRHRAVVLPAFAPIRRE